MPEGSPKEILSVQRLSKNYRQIIAVEDVSFNVAEGEIVGLLGPNGAGKTTTINMILGVLAPTAGRIEIKGIEVAQNRSAALAHTNFAAVYAPLPANLTVEQNLRIFGMLYGVENLSASINALIEQFDLNKFRRKRYGILSSGEQTRACLAKAMLNRPKLLLLDEPTVSLDPATARDVRMRIRNFVVQEKCAVLWTSHNMYEVEEVCDRVLFLSRGKILLQGSPKVLAKEHGKETLEELFITVAKEPLSLEGES